LRDVKKTLLILQSLIRGLLIRHDFRLDRNLAVLVFYRQDGSAQLCRAHRPIVLAKDRWVKTDNLGAFGHRLYLSDRSKLLLLLLHCNYLFNVANNIVGRDHKLVKVVAITVAMRVEGAGG